MLKPSTTTQPPVNMLLISLPSHSFFRIYHFDLYIRALQHHQLSQHALSDQEGAMPPQIPASALEDPAFLELPVQTPPPGVIPNFSNPENQGSKLTVVGAVLLTFVIIALTNRAYTKIHIVQKFSWDDLTLSLSAIGAIFSYGVCVWGNSADIIFSPRTDEQ